MTSTTTTRQLRMLVDGVLSVYGIDNLQLSMDLCAAIRQVYDSPTPAKTREEILAGLERNAARSADKQLRMDEIRNEIETRVRIHPTGNAWEDFVKWAYGKEKDGQNITVFLDWWLSDEWRVAHPPFKPDGWYVQWPQAFIPQVERPEYKLLPPDPNEGKYVPAPPRRKREA